MTDLRQQPSSSRGKHRDSHVRCANCGDRTSDPRGIIGAIWCPACREAAEHQAAMKQEWDDRDERISGYARHLAHNQRLHEQAQKRRPHPKPATDFERAQYGL